MLRLNEKQLEFLIIVDMQDDWHPAAFLDIVAENHSKNKAIEERDFDSLMEKLGKLSTEKIAELQVALNILGLL